MGCCGGFELLPLRASLLELLPLRAGLLELLPLHTSLSLVHHRYQPLSAMASRRGRARTRRLFVRAAAIAPCSILQLLPRTRLPWRCMNALAVAAEASADRRAPV